MPYFYLASRCRSDDSLYGPMHGSCDADKTLCGLDIDWKWWILNTEKSDGVKVTCKKCLSKTEKESSNEDAD